MTKIIIVSIVLFIFLNSATAQKTKSNLNNVSTSVQIYINGLATGDIEMLNRVLYPGATCMQSEKGVLQQYAVQEWLEKFSDWKNTFKESKISRIDITDDAASIRVETRLGKEMLVDYLNMLLISNEWKIVNWVFSIFTDK